MDKEMRKRLEKAAEEYAETYKASLQKTAFRSFVAGAEHGYKEAIEQAKEWLEGHFREITNPDFATIRNHPTEIQDMYHWSIAEMVADFETDMNKLWEEKK